MVNSKIRRKSRFKKRGGTEKQSGQMLVIMSVQEMLITSKVRSFFSLFCFRKIKGLMMFRPEVIVHEGLTHSYEFFRTGRVNSHCVVKIRFCCTHFNSNSKTLDHFIHTKTNTV